MSKPQLPLGYAITQLNDEVAEVTNLNAFLLHALALSVAEYDWLNPQIISGARLYAEALMRRNDEMKGRMQQVHQQYQVAHPEVGS